MYLLQHIIYIFSINLCAKDQFRKHVVNFKIIIVKFTKLQQLFLDFRNITKNKI